MSVNRDEIKHLLRNDGTNCYGKESAMIFDASRYLRPVAPLKRVPVDRDVKTQIKSVLPSPGIFLVNPSISQRVLRVRFRCVYAL